MLLAVSLGYVLLVHILSWRPLGEEGGGGRKVSWGRRVVSTWPWGPGSWGRSSPGRTWRVTSPGHWQGCRHNSVEGWYLRSSSDLGLLYIWWAVSFIWEINDLRWGRNPQVIFSRIMLCTLLSLCKLGFQVMGLWSEDNRQNLLSVTYFYNTRPCVLLLY